MKRFGFLSVALFPLLCFLQASTVCAQQVAFHFEPSQTQIRWSMRENLRKVEGTATLTGGLIAMNPASGLAQGQLLIDIDSLHTGNDARDKRIKNEVAEAEKYPQAFFHPSKVAGSLGESGRQTLKIEGQFNLHGQDHPMTLLVDVDRKGDRAEVITRFKIPYVAWGMKRPGGWFWSTSREIAVEVKAVARVETPAPGTAKKESQQEKP